MSHWQQKRFAFFIKSFLHIFSESVLLRLRSSWLKQMWTKTENWTMMSFLECCFENLPLTIKTCINKLNEVLHSPDKYIFHVISRALKYLSSVFVLFVFWSICLANAGGSESIQISTLTMCCHHFTNANAQDNAIYDWNKSLFIFIHLISSKCFLGDLITSTIICNKNNCCGKGARKLRHGTVQQ